MSLRQILRNFLKRIYINNYGRVNLDDSARIGNYSQLLVTDENGFKSTSKISIHNNVGIGRYNELQVWDDNEIIIKEYSSLNDNCKILGDVVIERFCLFSANIYASSGNHYANANPPWLIKDQDAFVLSSEEGRKSHSKKIHIEEDCWVGYGVFIKQGIYIGRGAVIGAYTVVTKDVPPYSVQIGSPNREIKSRLKFEPPMEVSCQNDEHLPYFYRGFGHRRSALTHSRKKNVISAENESILVLAGVGNPEELHITGKNMIYPGNLNLSISLNGQFSWEPVITTQEFNLKLNLSEAILKAPDHLFQSIGLGLKKYSIICFNIQAPDKSVKNPIAFSTIKLK